MAKRIVVLGWGGEAIEIPTALDADAFVASGTLRVSLTQWAGPLGDATVLVPSESYLAAIKASDDCDDEAAYHAVFRTIEKLARGACRFEVETPIPVGAESE